MRITNSMMQSQVVFNMQRSVSKFMDLQQDMSSGRRINVPSDDPTGTLQDLNFRTELSKIEQYNKSVNKALSRMGIYDSTMADLKNMVDQAKDHASGMASDQFDATARISAADDVKSIFESLVRLGNTEFNGSKLFAGFNTKTTPFEVATNGVVYRGDEGKIRYEIENGLKTEVNFTGAEVMMAPTRNLGEDADLNVGITDSTLITDLHGATGIDMVAGSFTVTDNNLNITATVDLNAAPPVTTVGELITRINNDLLANVPPITNLTATISGTGNSVAFEAVTNGLVSDSTSLGNLNSGNGVDLDPARLLVSNGAGTSTEVDLTGAVTLGDVRTAFNAAMIASGDPGLANVTMTLNAAGTGLQIDDANGPPLDLSIADTTAAGRVAEDLGISGGVGAQLIGADLAPRVSIDLAETTGTTAADLGIGGNYSSNFDGTDIDPALTANSLLTDMNNGLGYDRGRIKISHGDVNTTIDLSDPSLVTIQDLLDRINNSGLSITASINDSGQGIQIVNDDIYRTLAIEEDGNSRSAKQMGLWGGGDIFASVMVLENALRANDSEGAAMIMGHLEEGLQRLIQFRGAVGSKAVALENTSTRLLDQHLNYTTRLSEVEDADFAELITNLATQENVYQAALMASAKIIQPSLMNFLR